MMFNCSLSITLLFVIVVTSEAISDIGGCPEENLNLAKCAEPHQKYITKTLSKVNGSEVLDLQFMENFLNFTKNLSECIGPNVKCDLSRHYRFFLDSLNYIGNIVYDSEVFKCLENIPGHLQNCYYTDYEKYKFMSPKVLTNDAQQFIRCVETSLENNKICSPSINKLKCGFVALRSVAKHYGKFKNGKMHVKIFNPKTMKKVIWDDVDCDF